MTGFTTWCEMIGVASFLNDFENVISVSEGNFL
jgi:hypothetical protein